MTSETFKISVLVGRVHKLLVFFVALQCPLQDTSLLLCPLQGLFFCWVKGGLGWLPSGISSGACWAKTTSKPLLLSGLQAH